MNLVILDVQLQLTANAAVGAYGGGFGGLPPRPVFKGLLGQSTEPWLGYVNVFELPENGGAYVFGSPWGVADLVANFDDPNEKVTFRATPIATADGFWYKNGTGGPGAEGNKLVEANLYIEMTDDALAGQTMTFEGDVLSNTFVAGRAAYIFIKDFAPDYSSFNQTIIPAVPGPFSISLGLDPGLGRHVQYGFQNVGANVWPSDIALAGNVVYGTIPEPGALAMLAIGGLALLRRRPA